jgi:hypothetical protein
MRMTVAMGFALLLLVPASAAPQADRTPIVSVQPDAASDVSAVRRKKVKRKPVKQEQYLRAVPSTPPPGTRM